jgi:hypothetical protein
MDSAHEPEGWTKIRSRQIAQQQRSDQTQRSSVITLGGDVLPALQRSGQLIAQHPSQFG